MAYSTVEQLTTKLRTFLSAGMWSGVTGSSLTARCEDYIAAADAEIKSRIAGKFTVTDATACGIDECSALLAAYKSVQDEFSGRGDSVENSESARSWREDAERILAAMTTLTNDEIDATEGIEVPSTSVGAQLPCVTSTITTKASVRRTDYAGVDRTYNGVSPWEL